MRVPEASSRVLARVGPRMRRSDLATSAAPGDVISPAVCRRHRPSRGLCSSVPEPSGLCEKPVAAALVWRCLRDFHRPYG